MTVKLVPFFRPRMIFLLGRKKGGIVGTMGPGSIPLANRPSPMALTGPGPKVNRPRNSRENFRPSMAPTGPGYKVSRPRNARATFRPGTRVPLIPDASFPDAPKCPDTPSLGCLLSQSATSPNETANQRFMI